MIKSAEQLGFMKVRALKVCTKAEISRRVRYIKSCSRANFQQSGFENEISGYFKGYMVRSLVACKEKYVC
jgi:hypothetical protein